MSPPVRSRTPFTSGYVLVVFFLPETVHSSVSLVTSAPKAVRPILPFTHKNAAWHTHSEKHNLSCGGVRVTEHFEVLGWDMKPIKGLYAAGVTVAGVHGAYYCGGNACDFAHTSGYMAGKYVTGYKEA